MKWQTKAFILRQLSQMPMGKHLYLLLQKTKGSNRAQPRRDFSRIGELLEMIQTSGHSSEGKSFFEIGTGWHPYAPLGCYLADAEKITTVDVNPWLTLKSAKECVIAAKDHLPWLAELMGDEHSTLLNRYRKIDRNAKTLTGFLASMRTEYQYPGDASDTHLSENSFDFVISSNVLEHIELQILKSISKESFRILKPGGLCVHRINPGDHYANEDSSITTANFLQFAEEDWKKYGNGLAYHNRLRYSEFIHILADEGFASVFEKKRVDPQALEALKNKTIEPDNNFSNFSLEDLATDYMWYTGMKPIPLNKPVPDSYHNATVSS